MADRFDVAVSLACCRCADEKLCAMSVGHYSRDDLACDLLEHAVPRGMEDDAGRFMDAAIEHFIRLTTECRCGNHARHARVAGVTARGAS